MRLIKTLSALTLALLLAVAAMGQAKQAPNQQNTAAPKMVIESVMHDFGEVKSGAPLRHAFKIRNEGKGNLEIRSVAPG